MKFFVHLLAAIALLLAPLNIRAQQTPAATPQAQDDSGPQSDSGPIVLPQKKDADTPPPAPAAPKPKNPNGETYSLNVNVPLVTLDVNVLLDQTHQFVPNLKAENFVVLEDNVQQEVQTVRITQTPITAVLLLEFAANNYYVIRDMQNTAVSFFRQLKPNDYTAVVTYDLHTHILTDFTNNQAVIAEAIRSLTVPLFTDTNMFDALYETLDRISRIEGRKYIILVGTGRDTFSKINLDKILAKIKATPNVTIFSIGTGQLIQELDTRNSMGASMARMNALQAQNQMRTFASMTGGLSYFPLFPTELPADFGQINDSIRNQYVLTYRPTNTANDGSYRKVKVFLVDKEGKQLRMADEKGKPLKYSVITRDGYTAKRPVE